MRYSYSFDEENYHGSFATIDEAIAEGLQYTIDNEGATFFVAECHPPQQPETFWDAYDWLDHVSEQENYDSDWAEDWNKSTPLQRKELDEEVRKVLAAWLDRHDLRPTFYMAENAKEYQVVDGKAVEKVGAQP